MIYLITLRGITSVNFFFSPLTQSPRLEPQGRGMGAPSELLTLLPPPSQHPLPSACARRPHSSAGINRPPFRPGPPALSHQSTNEPLLGAQLSASNTRAAREKRGGPTFRDSVLHLGR